TKRGLGTTSPGTFTAMTAEPSHSPIMRLAVAIDGETRVVRARIAESGPEEDRLLTCRGAVKRPPHGGDSCNSERRGSGAFFCHHMPLLCHFDPTAWTAMSEPTANPKFRENRPGTR